MNSQVVSGIVHNLLTDGRQQLIDYRTTINQLSHQANHWERATSTSQLIYELKHLPQAATTSVKKTINRTHALIDSVKQLTTASKELGENVKNVINQADQLTAFADDVNQGLNQFIHQNQSHLAQINQLMNHH